MTNEESEYDKLLKACDALRTVATIHEHRLQRMERIQMALLKAAGAFLRSLEEQDGGGNGPHG